MESIAETLRLSHNMLKISLNICPVSLQIYAAAAYQARNI